MSNEIVDIVVFGATAVTGKHTVRYLLSHRERSTFTFAIAGRSSNKLSALRAELSIPDCVPTIVADSFDADSIAAMVAKAKVVINLAGPYNVFNARGIVAECVKQGKAYTDLTGESGFYKKVIDEFHDQAKQNGVPIVMSCGFDSTPSDMGTFLAVQHLKSQAPASRITDVTTAVRISSTIGKGTLMSGVDMVTQSKRENEDTTWQLKSVRPDEFSPIDSKRPMPWGPVIKAPHGTRAGALAFFPLACHNHRVVSRTWGLLETELKGNKEAYGDAFQYAEGIVMPNATVAAIVTIFVKTFLLFQIWFPPARWAVQALPDGFVLDLNGLLSKEPFMDIRTVAQSEAGQSSIATIYHKGDPAFESTARMQVEATLTLIQDPQSLLLKGGVITPALLGKRYTERLVQNAGFKIETRSVGGGDDDEGSKKFK